MRSICVTFNVLHSGVQHVLGDISGLHHCAQRGSPGLALCAAHSAAKENGSWPLGLSPSQGPEGSGHHKVGPVIMLVMNLNSFHY